MSELIGATYRYIHILIILFLLILIYPLYRILRFTFNTNIGVQHSTHKYGIKITKSTKKLLLISIIVSYSYIITTSIQTILMFIDYKQISSSICPFFASYRMFSYVTGRAVLYLFFIGRANDIFADTYLAFSTRTLIILRCYVFLFIITVVIPSIYIYYGMTKYYIKSDITNHGSYCYQYENENVSNPLKLVFIWGSLNDMTYSILTIFLMVSRLFLLLFQNERKKSNGIRYQYSGSPTTGKAALTTPQPSINRINSLSTTNIDSTVQSTPPPIHKQQVSHQDTINFHYATSDHNRLVLLISKFFIIMLCLILSSQFALILFVIFRKWVILFYSLDTLINLCCLWLTFSFSDTIYNKYFCGKCCTPFCFPIIKTFALSLGEYETQYQQTHNMNNKCFSNKICIYFTCCCCVSCRYCCLRESLSKEIYDLAKKEIKFIQTVNKEKQKYKNNNSNVDNKIETDDTKKSECTSTDV